MSALQLIVLALVQGITEFLPISSSGHLALLPAIGPWPDQGPALDVAVHVGTLVAVLLYFRRDTVGLAAAAFGSIGVAPARKHAEASGHLSLFWYLVVATLPVIGVGLALSMLDLVEHLRTPAVIAGASIGFGLLLYIIDQRAPDARDLGDVRLKTSLQIGIAQVFALIPGASRAGVTMTAARALGFSRTEAARFSMLLSIPTILGAGVLTALDLNLGGADAAFWQDAGLAALLSCIAALLAIHFLMKWLVSASMTLFVVYRVALGLVIFAAIGLGWI